MMRLALALSGFLIYFIQAQLLPTIFHTNWLPNLILTIIVMINNFYDTVLIIFTMLLRGFIVDGLSKGQFVGITSYTR